MYKNEILGGEQEQIFTSLNDSILIYVSLNEGRWVCDLNQGKEALAVGDIVIALRDFPGQQRSVPKGTRGEIVMPESNGLIRVQFGEVIKDVPARDLEAVL